MRSPDFLPKPMEAGMGEQAPLPERPLHRKARQEKPPMYPERFPVPDEKVDWGVEYPDYKPSYFVAKVVLDNDVTKNPKGWADPEDVAVAQERKALHSYEGELKFDDNKRPQNPHGRTGIEGRGLLGKWGANFAADPIVTRINPDTKMVEMLAIQRKDNGQWAIPGGMVDEGEAVSVTLKREFQEEAGVDLDMDDATEVYRGYVDDPRNTDNAWMETTARHKHLLPDLAAKINPEAGDDAQAVRWLSLSPEALGNLYASHGELLKKALGGLYERDRDNIPVEAREQIEMILGV